MRRREPDIPVMYEDNHLLIVVKPPNVPSQEDASGDPDVLAILKKYLKQKYNKPGNVFLSLVHRLDRPVGGVMVLARTSKSASRLSAQVRDRTTWKKYLCVVKGKPHPPSGKLEDSLVKDGQSNLVRVAEKDEPGAKRAVLEYKVIQSKRGLSLVEVNLITGRSHQIRVQFSSAGFPVYGDQRYSAESDEEGEQIALWSSEISFMHPVKNEKMTFPSSPPEKFPWNNFTF